MRSLIATLLIAVSLPAQALQVCGLYQNEDFGDRILYSLVRFTATEYAGNLQTVFSIINPGSLVVRGMIRGMCYCVSGDVQKDPEFPGDENYQLLMVTKIEDQAYTGCLPSQVPPEQHPSY